MENKRPEVFQVSLNCDSKIKGFETSSLCITGIVIANSKKEAEDLAVDGFQDALNKQGAPIKVTLVSIEALPSSFILVADK